MPTTALIAGGVSAAGSIGSSVIGGLFQSQNASNALNAIRGMYGQGMNWANNLYTGASNMLAPYIGAGTSALGAYQAAAPGLTAPFSAATLPSTPGYQFTLSQGLKSTQNAYAAQGLGSSGASEKGAAQFATGLAQNTYNQQFQNYLAQNQQIANLLLAPVQAGTQAASAQSSLASVLGSAGLQASTASGANQAGVYTGLGNALAGATTGAASGITGGVNNALQYSLLNQYLQNQGAQTWDVSGLPTGVQASNPYVSTAVATNPATAGVPYSSGGYPFMYAGG